MAHTSTEKNILNSILEKESVTEKYNLPESLLDEPETVKCLLEMANVFFENISCKKLKNSIQCV